MIYHLVDFLSDQGIVFPFSRLFTYVSFRVGMAIILALLISTIWGSRLIKYLRRRQIGELVRDLGLEGEQTKKGTPTMGGIIIILAILIPTLLFARLDNIYIILMIVTTILMGLLGFADDYIKVFKKDKNGLKEHYKILGQLVLGLIVGVVLGVLAYVSSHHDMAGYLNTMFIPGAEELVIFAATLVGATVGFLWYNSYPAQVFMGDTGSLALGGIIGVFAILIRKELLLPILCGVFIAEFTSSFIQRFYYKYTRHRTGTGVRVFKMAPLHHHFQLPGGAATNSLLKRPVDKVPEAKLTMRFWLIGIILAVLTIVTLKIR